MVQLRQQRNNLIQSTEKIFLGFEENLRPIGLSFMTIVNPLMEESNNLKDPITLPLGAKAKNDDLIRGNCYSFNKCISTRTWKNFLGFAPLFGYACGRKKVDKDKSERSPLVRLQWRYLGQNKDLLYL